ncbi:MAG TPA: hypothetical protein VFV83_01975 [Chthoniobacteraceae bacterium]|nr:hypothetical protein [Chthoniobacteraceae bacterium]
MRSSHPQFAAAIALLLLSALANAGEDSLNDTVLRAIGTIPRGGGYATDSATTALLGRATEATGGRLLLHPAVARPSYCSGATYVVFLRAIDELMAAGALRLDPAIVNALLVRGQPDGEGVWGRWNANGPGTARLFHEAQLGRNFSDFAAARPGDFMKIFWNSEVGRLERGHSVVFLGTERVDGKERVRFWSSNKPLGYGEKSVARSQIVRAIFSRFEHPGNLSRLGDIPRRDPYLASLLGARSSFAEARKKCGIE